MSAGARAWAALAALLGLLALAAAAWGVPDALDWQPDRAWREPWRAWTAAAVHLSALHLGANLAGVLVLGALGAAAGVTPSCAGAWFVAWPLTQFGLALRPDLLHYGGLSGVLHAGVAIVVVQLVATGPGRRRHIGLAIGAGLAFKLLLEAPWGPAVVHPAGWDIGVAPFAHACGTLAGFACGLAARAITRSRAP